MLKVLRDDATGEMELSGTRSELLALGQQLRSGRGQIRLLEITDPSPYGRSLSWITCGTAATKVMLSVRGDRESLDVRGEPEFLAVLAENVESFASEADRSDHLHVDYFPEHFYLEEGTDSLIVIIDDDQ